MPDETRVPDREHHTPVMETPPLNRNEGFMTETSQPLVGDRGYFIDPVFEEARRAFRHFGPHTRRKEEPVEPPRYYGIGPANYVRSDEQIREDVVHRLQREEGLDASGITVEVEEGRVVLSGTVPSHSQIFLAEETIGDVIGNKRIENRLGDST